jgi:hypothetical protein
VSNTFNCPHCGAEIEVQQPKVEPVQEEIKLYCVKDFEPGYWYTKGKIYKMTKNSYNEYYSLPTDHSFIDNTFNPKVTTLIDDLKLVGNFLVPLISRSAKVGEWVKSDHIHGSSFEDSVARVIGYSGTGIKVEFLFRSSDQRRLDGEGWYIRDDNYLVLDGYNPATPTIPVTRQMLVDLKACFEGLRDFDRQYPSGKTDYDTMMDECTRQNQRSYKIWLAEHKQQIIDWKPVEYYNGKVVCVETHFPKLYTVGKVYTVINGEMNENLGPVSFCDGKARFKDLDNINRRLGAKFIEYKGEQS